MASIQPPQALSEFVVELLRVENDVILDMLFVHVALLKLWRG
jgi:hypothetical protein